jgi:uncharacterized protein (TIGR03083 family)
MGEVMSATAFVDRIRRARREWDALLAQVDEGRMAQAGACGEWSIKDVVAHITWHEREMIKLLETRTLAGSELWELPLDERNEAIFEENQRRALEEVREEARGVFDVLLRQAETLADEELHDASRFSGMPPDWQPWQVIAENTYEHYEDHSSQVRAWLME